MKKNVLYIITSVLFSLSALADGNQPGGSPKTQTIDAQDSIVFDCSQLTGATGAIQIPVSVISDDTIYSVDFSLKYDHNALQYDTTINVTTYLQALSYYNTIDSTIRFTSSTFSPVTHDTTVALVKFILLSPAFNTANLYTFKGYLNGTLCSIKYIPPSPLGVEENVMKYFTIYPNPAQDVVSINFENANRLELIDMLGQTVYSESIEGMTTTHLNTSDVVNGVYFVKLYTSNGNGLRKLIVSH